MIRWLPLLLTAIATRAEAQARSRPFETLTAGLGASIALSEGALQRYWDAGLGVAAGATTPFHAGVLEAGLQVRRYSPRQAGLPPFRGWFGYLGWNVGHRLRGVELRGGARVGAFAFRFEGESIPSSRRRESELAVALRGSVQYPMWGRWLIEAGAEYQSVLTDPRLEQVLISLGIGRRFTTPAWLRDFLD